jgi:hypothetical protein
VARRQVLLPAHQQVEAPPELAEHLRRAEHLRPRRRQFERQRQPLQPHAQLRQRPGIPFRHLEIRPHRPRPVDEELHGRVGVQAFRCSGVQVSGLDLLNA